MLMVVEKSSAADLALAPAAWAGTLERMVIEARFGETYRFAADRCAVELLVSFRPGVDRIVVAVRADAPRGARVVTTEEAGNAVILDGAGRRIVIEGVGIADLLRGDIEVERSA